MSIFKCKMCGGTIEVKKGTTIGVCDSCGTKQTLPRLDDDRRTNLYDRANHFRRNNEFDKAASIYDQILNEDGKDAEAYWSLVLCRYGIEYVEDLSLHKRVPTVNRAQFTSIFDDEDYKAAILNADAIQREVYEVEANAINELQKAILAISQKETPFDVFICYKETDNNGLRTQDSVLANDLYHQLTQEGLKVFFSRITLEDKLGTAYEPYIFAALNSAKVMVVLGTKPENFNVVWVKNEWSRYLALVKNSNGKKILIPAYKDMDPYDLPEEFSHLQAQDMSKLGFMQDLIRGIKKIISAAEPNATVKETIVVNNTMNANIAPLLKRVFMFLEDDEWNNADEYCEKVLDQDPENAQAFLGKLMSEMNIRKKEDLKECEQPFDDRNNYQKVIRFGDAALKSELIGYTSHIKECNVNNRLTDIYNGAVSIMNSATTESALKDAANTFKSIRDFKESDGLAEQCLAKAEVCRKDALYTAGKSKMTGEKMDNYEIAIETFQTISEWKDSDEQIVVCKHKIEEIKAKEEEHKIAAEKTIKKRKKIIAITTPIVCVCIAFLIILSIIKDTKIKNAGADDAVLFGAYEQDNITSNGKEDIEWQVLAKEGKNILVISKYALDCQQYNTYWTEITWEDCSLREWMNETFINAAFSVDEQDKIQNTNVSADKNPYYNSAIPGNTTTDKVFMLSINEVEKYLSSEEVKKCIPTEYAIANGALISSIEISGGKATCWWWLRSPGYNRVSTAYVCDDGSVYSYGVDADEENNCVRPALWITLDS